MDTILGILNDSRQSSLFPLWQSAGIIVWVATVALGMAVLRDNLRADIREALRHAGISHKAAAVDMGITEGLLSRKLSGEKVLTLEALEPLPEPFWQWLAVTLARRYGVPSLVLAAEQLHHVSQQERV